MVKIFLEIAILLFLILVIMASRREWIKINIFAEFITVILCGMYLYINTLIYTDILYGIIAITNIFFITNDLMQLKKIKQWGNEKWA